MRRDSTFFELTNLLFTPLFLVFTCLSALGCGSSEAGSSLPRHVFRGEGCEGAVEGAALASPLVREETAIRSYAYRFDDEGMHLLLLDEEGEELGEVRTQLHIERLQPTRWTVETWLSRGGEEVARQTLHGQALGRDRIQLETINRLGELESRSWATLDAGFELERTSLGVPVEAGSGEEVVLGPDGYFDVIQTSAEGAPIEEGVFESWLGERGLDAFAASEDWRLLAFAADDEAWSDAADLELRRCQAFDETTGVASAGSSDEDEGEALGALAQGLCGTTHSSSAGLGVLEQGACSKQENPFAGVLEARALHAAFAAGIKITGSLVITGVVTSGLGIGVTLIGTTIAVWYVSKAIGKWVDDNKRTVVEGTVWVGGGIKDRNRSDNTVVVDFFAGSTGDPHLDTFDGLAYNLQSAGEFVLVRSTSGDELEVQVRHEPIAGICSGVSINTAVAARVDGDRLSFEVGRSSVLWVNGEPMGLPGGVLALPGGGLIEEREGEFFVQWRDGSSMKIGRLFAGRADVRIGLAPERRGTVEGLLGNFNGDRRDDLVLADGTVLGSPLRWSELVGPFSDSWRVDASTSLFDYAEGEGTDTFLIDGFPARPTTVDDLPAEDRDEARAICLDGGIEDPVVLDACTLDVACTGNPSFVDAHEDRDPDELADISQPVFLDGWLQAGRSNHGTWVVSEDGRSVRQSVNGEPTFFVSDRDYFGSRIRGSFHVNGSDDDFIGFVFGFRSPVPLTDDDLDTYDAFFFSWKSRDQTDGGFFGPAGFTLYHLNRTVPRAEVREIFWGVEEAQGRPILATDHDSEKGWVRGEVYEFELVYTSELIEISIDGELIFSLGQDESPVPFQPGLFGFYNYSQPGVNYGDFEAIELR